MLRRVCREHHRSDYRHGSQITDHRSRLRGKVTDPELKSSDVICTCPKRLSSNVSRIHAGSISRTVRSGPGPDPALLPEFGGSEEARKRGSEVGSKTETRVTSRRQPGDTKATSAPSATAACSLFSCAGRTSSQEGCRPSEPASCSGTGSGNVKRDACRGTGRGHWRGRGHFRRGGSGCGCGCPRTEPLPSIPATFSSTST